MNQKPTELKQRPSSVHGSQLFNLQSAGKALRISVAVLFAGASTVLAGNTPSGTVSGSGSGPYIDTLTFSDSASATSPIGSVWYGWLPPYYNYLPSVPTSASAPAGWSAMISANSIEFVASSPAYYIQPGGMLQGFSYTAAFSPTTLASNPAAAYSYAYVGPIEGDPGTFFSVTTVVPEPSTAALFGIGALGLGVVRRRKQ